MRVKESKRRFERNKIESHIGCRLVRANGSDGEATTGTSLHIICLDPERQPQQAKLHNLHTALLVFIHFSTVHSIKFILSSTIHGVYGTFKRAQHTNEEEEKTLHYILLSITNDEK